MYWHWNLQKQKLTPIHIHTSRNCGYVFFEALMVGVNILSNDIRIELKRDFPNLKVYTCMCQNGN